MTYTANPASVSGIGESELVVSTASGTPTVMHTLSGASAKARISLKARNIDTVARTLYVRISDGTTVGAYQTFAFPAPAATSVNLGTWIFDEILIAGDGTAAVKVECYAETTNIFEVFMTVIEDA